MTAHRHHHQEASLKETQGRPKFPCPPRGAGWAQSSPGGAQEALLHAEALCTARGVRLTPLRRRVLELVQSRTEAVKAYDLLAQLSTEDHAAKPPTVYRALDFLLEQGLIHRVDSLNAFVGCNHPDTPHAAHLLLCARCGRVEELHSDAVDAAIAKAVAATGFVARHARLEVQGLCAACAAATQDD